jgi:sulfate permease, SulP family
VQAVPASLAAVLISTTLEYALIRRLGYSTNTVSDFGEINSSFPLPIWVDDTTYGYANNLPTLDWQLVTEILPTALSVALVGLFESLLTLQICDELLEDNTGGSNAANREAYSQGLAQFLAAMFGGMGGCTAIGQSILNILSGGYTRVSSSVAALFLLLITLVAAPVLNAIPVASLSGLMLLVTFFTIEWNSLRVLVSSCCCSCCFGCLPQKYSNRTKVNRGDVAVILVVIVMSLTMDLAVGVLSGVILSCMFFAYEASSRVTIHRQESSSSDNSKKSTSSVRYTIRGPVFFGSVKGITEGLFPLDGASSSLSQSEGDEGAEEHNDQRLPTMVATVDLENAEIFDWSGIEALRTWSDRFLRTGTTARFEHLSPPTRRLLSKTKRLWKGVCVVDQDGNMEDVDADGGESTDESDEASRTGEVDVFDGSGGDVEGSHKNCSNTTNNINAVPRRNPINSARTSRSRTKRSKRRESGMIRGASDVSNKQQQQQQTRKPRILLLFVLLTILLLLLQTPPTKLLLIRRNWQPC